MHKSHIYINLNPFSFLHDYHPQINYICVFFSMISIDQFIFLDLLSKIKFDKILALSYESIIYHIH